MTAAPDLSPEEAELVELFELSDDGPFDPCPDCGYDPEDHTLHAEGCPRYSPGMTLMHLQFGPPWAPWPEPIEKKS